LVLKVACNSKSERVYEVKKPSEIPLGQGIAGCVALKGISEIVRDTSTDDRYIQYDEPRLSEIVVPIVLEEKVIGVIDSDHPERNYFKPRHLRVLNTVAWLCAAKIGKQKLT
jgi:putative methionine-R-sulfoxide reductase with GAF domain